MPSSRCKCEVLALLPGSTTSTQPSALVSLRNIKMTKKPSTDINRLKCRTAFDTNGHRDKSTSFGYPGRWQLRDTISGYSDHFQLYQRKRLLLPVKSITTVQDLLECSYGKTTPLSISTLLTSPFCTAVLGLYSARWLLRGVWRGSEINKSWGPHLLISLLFGVWNCRSCGKNLVVFLTCVLVHHLSVS